jgi:hypothetical protein
VATKGRRNEARGLKLDQVDTESRVLCIPTSIAELTDPVTHTEWVRRGFRPERGLPVTATAASFPPLPRGRGDAG